MPGEQGLSAVMANTGVDVSLGRVTKAFEIIPVYGRPVKVSSPACFHQQQRRVLGCDHDALAVSRCASLEKPVPDLLNARLNCHTRAPSFVHAKPGEAKCVRACACMHRHHV